MPEPESNSANLKFLKSIFKKEIRENYPDFNYRLRLAGLTEFEPYISEAARISEESDGQYESRVATSGRLFGEQEILLNDIVHSEQNISGLAVNSTFHDGSIPETVLFLEECKLDETKKLYDVTAYNLNHLDFTTTASPVVAFPVDLSEDEKGYYIYRKTSAVQKNGSNNDKITEIHTGWEKVAEFSNNDLKSLLASTDLSKVGSQFPLGYIDSGISGYSGWTNELFTNYKILDSGNVGDPTADTSYLSNPRTLDFVTDQSKSYTVQRKINRLSNTADNPAGWEEIERQADFPYTDAEVLSDLISVEVSSRISGTYGVIEPTGVHSVADQDFFEIDLINDWGKAELKDYTFNQDSKELIFKSGESLKVTQKAFSDIPLGNQEILGSVEMSFSPHTTGISGSITGVIILRISMN